MAIESKRHMAVHSPLGEDVLFVRHLTGSEQLGQCFEYQLGLFSESHDIKLEDLLGQNVSVQLSVHGFEPRYFDGIVTELSYEGASGRFASYQLTLRPWLWLLSRNQECRIFQDKTVVEIIGQIFRERGFSDVAHSLSATYQPRKYCVQHRESDLMFVSRLMEEEGIYYFFHHEMKKHTLVLADSLVAHATVSGFETVGYRRVADPGSAEPGEFTQWSTSKQIRTGQVTLNDYDFKRPGADLTASSTGRSEHAHGEIEAYDYPGRYTDVSCGETLARVRLESLRARYELATGVTNAFGLYAGSLFTLADHPRAEQNRQYLTVAASYELDSGSFESGELHSDALFNARITALDSKTPFRPARVTPDAAVLGPQTAVVVGHAGQPMWTDEHACVKVQFPWDREGKRNEESSCWVRVSQAWAGAGYGSMHLPHIGQEVIVSFLEGDPDRPIVTGRVYNAWNKPWQDLPGQQKKNYFRDEGGNHILMDATKGKERIELSSPYANTKLSLGAPNSPTAGFTLLTDDNYEALVQGFQKIKILKDRTVEVVGNASKSVTGYLHDHVKGSYERKVEGQVNVHVGQFKNEVILGEVGTIIGGAKIDVIAGAKHETVAGSRTELHLGFVRRKHKLKVKDETKNDVEVKSDKEYLIRGGASKSHVSLNADRVEISSGDTKVVVNHDGAVTIETAKEVKINGKSVVLNVDDDFTLGASKAHIFADFYVNGVLQVKD